MHLHEESMSWLKKGDQKNISACKETQRLHAREAATGMISLSLHEWRPHAMMFDTQFLIREKIKLLVFIPCKVCMHATHIYQLLQVEIIRQLS